MHAEEKPVKDLEHLYDGKDHELNHSDNGFTAKSLVSGTSPMVFVSLPTALCLGPWSLSLCQRVSCLRPWSLSLRQRFRVFDHGLCLFANGFVSSTMVFVSSPTGFVSSTMVFVSSPTVSCLRPWSLSLRQRFYVFDHCLYLFANGRWLRPWSLFHRPWVSHASSCCYFVFFKNWGC
jgi:hypothetical protein